MFRGTEAERHVQFGAVLFVGTHGSFFFEWEKCVKGSQSLIDKVYWDDFALTCFVAEEASHMRIQMLNCGIMIISEVVLKVADPPHFVTAKLAQLFERKIGINTHFFRSL